MQTQIKLFPRLKARIKPHLNVCGHGLQEYEGRHLEERPGAECDEGDQTQGKGWVYVLGILPIRQPHHQGTDDHDD